jgi:lysophospholipase L1-like esterase
MNRLMVSLSSGGREGGLKGICVGLALALASALPGAGQAAPVHWVGSWAAAQQLPEPANALPDDALHGTTLRQTVHLSLGGSRLRVLLSNVYGTAPLHLTAVHIARPLPKVRGAIVPQSDTALSFSGRADVTIPPGADYLSDPVAFAVAPLSDVSVTLHYDTLAASPTGHPGSRATSFFAAGDAVSAAELPAARTVAHWYVLAGIDVAAPPRAGAVVALGDSITDGRGSTTDFNDRWPDDLARRLQQNATTRGIGVLNKGIGGNRLLLDGLGPNALARFDRDVLAEPGVRALIVLEGVNDLGVLTRDAPAAAEAHAALVAEVTAAYAQIVARAHAHGIKVLCGTILPWMGFTYYHPDAANEADRQAVNAWLRAPGHCDAGVDFDARLSDPADRSRLLPAFEDGDHLHPSPAGYQAMANAIPLGFFAPQRVHRVPRKGQRR